MEYPNIVYFQITSEFAFIREVAMFKIKKIDIIIS